jgi:hypothetical protein
MKKDFKRRIEALEAKFIQEPVTIHLADGSQRVIRGDVQHWFALNKAGIRITHAEDNGLPIPEDPLSDEIEWLRNSVRIEEAAGMFGLLWAMLAGPTERGAVNPERMQ